jgi:hypothetical protein
MNSALELYNSDERVGCIHGWNYDLDFSDYNESTFFLTGADCWGWATWKRSWNLFNVSSKELLTHIDKFNLKYILNRRGRYNYYNMLKDNFNGLNNSWAIRWHASLIINYKYCLYPTKTLVKNIGLDGSGTHCSDDDIEQWFDFNTSLVLTKVKIEDCVSYYSAYDKYFKTHYNDTLWTKLKALLKKHILNF